MVKVKHKDNFRKVLKLPTFIFSISQHGSYCWHLNGIFLISLKYIKVLNLFIETQILHSEVFIPLSKVIQLLLTKLLSLHSQVHISVFYPYILTTHQNAISGN